MVIIGPSRYVLFSRSLLYVPSAGGMDIVIVTGRVSEGELRGKRSEAYRRRVEERTLAASVADPPPRLRSLGRIRGGATVAIAPFSKACGH